MKIMERIKMEPQGVFTELPVLIAVVIHLSLVAGGG